MVCMCTRSAHIQGKKHKKKLESLRKRARRLAAAQTNSDVHSVDGHTDAVANSCIVSEDVSD